MEALRAQAIAERLHRHDHEEDGTPLLRHIGRVARLVPTEALPIAWLHEALEWTAASERMLLTEGLTAEELRALRLLNRRSDSRTSRIYLAHVELIARAAGHSGHLARIVKIADLEDRRVHPHIRSDGWSPPYARGLRLLLERTDAHDADGIAVARGMAL
jgi:hypothetical protein